MRRFLFIALAFLLLIAAAEQKRPATTPPGHERCCAMKVYDANNKELGEVITWDERVLNYPLTAWVRYPIQGGGDVALSVGADIIQGQVGPGGSSMIFTSNDCSGDVFITQLSYAPLMKRYAAVLLQGGGSWPFQIQHAWLYVTDPLPVRVNAGATVFHSQWDYNNTCTQYAPPGFTFPGPQYGFWAHKVEDLYAKFKRPFWIP